MENKMVLDEKVCADIIVFIGVERSVYIIHKARNV